MGLLVCCQQNLNGTVRYCVNRICVFVPALHYWASCSTVCYALVWGTLQSWVRGCRNLTSAGVLL